MLDTYVNWLNGADPTQYDWMNVENNLLPVLYTFWLCEARPEWTDTCHLFLLDGQRKSFEYINDSATRAPTMHAAQKLYARYCYADLTAALRQAVMYQPGSRTALRRANSTAPAATMRQP